MRIGIVADWLNPTIVETARRLTKRGAVVEVIYPEKQTIDLAQVSIRHDLYVLKSGSDLALSLAAVLHEMGAVSLNPYPIVATIKNKIVVTRILQAAGVPVPETYVTTHREDLRPFLRDGPLIIKPYRGSNGKGLFIVRNADELDRPQLEPIILAQRYHQSDGYDHKIFCIGGDLFGVKRIFPIRDYADKLGTPFRLTSELRAIAWRCIEALGIELFGMDVVISEGKPYVVDLNMFGSHMGVPDAPRRLTDYIYSAGQRVLQGQPLVSMQKRSTALEAGTQGLEGAWPQPESPADQPISSGGVTA